MRELNFHDNHDQGMRSVEKRCAFCHRPSGDGSHDGRAPHHFDLLMHLSDSGGDGLDAFDDGFSPSGLPHLQDRTPTDHLRAQLQRVPEVFRIHQPAKRRGRPPL